MRMSLTVLSNGFVFYDGPSQLDGLPILGVATGFRNPSENTKTGALIQTHILAKGTDPLSAMKDGTDASVCGDCVHRVFGGAGSCLVNVGHAPHQAWKAVGAGNYPHLAPSLIARHYPGRLWRAGYYGDPAAVPREVWAGLLADCGGVIGYTHQWRRKWAATYRDFLMASCETDDHVALAWSKGWRTYRTRLPEERLLHGEILCPADRPADALTCEQCMICDGSKGHRDRRVSVSTVVHGLSWKATRYRKAREAMANKKRFRVKGK